MSAPSSPSGKTLLSQASQSRVSFGTPNQASVSGQATLSHQQSMSAQMSSPKGSGGKTLSSTSSSASDYWDRDNIQKITKPWIGDFTVGRYRASLGKVNNIRMGENYTDKFCADRGGIQKVPYSVRDLAPPPRTDPKYPNLLTCPDHMEGKRTRLPEIAAKPKTLKKSQSCVYLHPGSDYNGKFGLLTTWVSEDKEKKTTGKKDTKEGKDGKDGGKQKEGPKQLTPTQAAATRRLWREASTGDVYYKAAKADGDKQMKAVTVPGVSEALAEGAQLDYKNPLADGMTLFMRACKSDNLAQVKHLANLGADMFVVDYSGRNVFHHVCAENSYNSMTWLLRAIDKPAPLLTAQDDKGNTPLHLSASKGSIVESELILKVKQREFLLMTNDLGETPLDCAIKNKMHHLRKLLNAEEYVRDQSTLAYRMAAKMGKAGVGEDDDDDEDEEDEEPDDDDEDGDAGGAKVGGKFKNLLSLDRECNKARAAEAKPKKGGKGKKKKKKK